MKLILTIAFLLAFLPAALAAEKDPPLPEAAAIEAYLNGISTLKSHFVQTANDGQRLTGTFMLKRPGRLRFEYDLPVTDLIVADGTFIHYYDGQMKQESSAPISQSLADFFLRPDLKLSGDIGVSGIERRNGLLEMTLVQSRDPLAGYLTLMFGENPLQLKKWVVIDAQGLTTAVALEDTQLGIALKNKLFYYYDPEHKKPILNK
jgi:outer membrane lipoprotein-sorting protein